MKKIIIASILLITSFVSMSQDVQFAMSNQNLIYSNPAFTGTSTSFRFEYLGRIEYSEINIPTINYFSVDQYLGKVGGVGFSYLKKTFYSKNEKMFNFNYAKSISLGSTSRLSIGFSGGLYEKDANWNEYPIECATGYVPTFKPIKRYDLNVGVLFYNNNFYMGYAVHHVTQPNYSFTENASYLYKRHDVQMGYRFILNESVEILPRVNLQSQNDYVGLNGMLQVKIKPILFGLGVDNNSGLLAMLGVSFNKWRLLYNYSSFISRIPDKYQASHEVSMQILLNLSKKERIGAFSIY